MGPYATTLSRRKENETNPVCSGQRSFMLYLVWGSIWIKGQYYDASLYMELALSLINDPGNFSLSNFPQVFRGANFAVILQLFHLLNNCISPPDMRKQYSGRVVSPTLKNPSGKRPPPEK